MYTKLHGVNYLNIDDKIIMLIADDFTPTIFGFVPDYIFCSEKIKNKVYNMFLEKLRSKIKIIII